MTKPAESFLVATETVGCRCMRDSCASCMERYLLAAAELERDLQPGGRLDQKMCRIHELVDEIVRKRGED